MSTRVYPRDSDGDVIMVDLTTATTSTPAARAYYDVKPEPSWPGSRHEQIPVSFVRPGEVVKAELPSPDTTAARSRALENVLQTYHDRPRTRFEGDPPPAPGRQGEWDRLRLPVPGGRPSTSSSSACDVQRLVGTKADALGQAAAAATSTDDPAETGRPFGAEGVAHANIALQSPQQFSSNLHNTRSAYRKQMEALLISKFIATNESTLAAREAAAGEAPPELTGEDGSIPGTGGLRSLVNSYVAVASETVTNQQSDLAGETPRATGVPQPPVLTRALLAPYLRAPVGRERACMHGAQCVSHGLAKWYLVTHPEDPVNYEPDEKGRRDGGRHPRPTFALRAFYLPHEDEETAPAKMCLLCNRFMTGLLARKLGMKVERNPIAHVVQDHGVICNQEGEYRAEHVVASGDAMNGLVEPFLPLVRSHYTRNRYVVKGHGEVDGWLEAAHLLFRASDLAQPGGAGDREQEATHSTLNPDHVRDTPGPTFTGDLHHTDDADVNDYERYYQEAEGEEAREGDDDEDRATYEQWER